ncbi:alpha/beta fold hydrolase [Aliishimia ponticola]|uniref:Alpha/beta fold hydrolase n=1 Tax=Aliishimia ponticola TaxID=2499833 RepID=A0A4S4NG27_9RHOB|nr:alpha/beta fold hydrolase [Aliishimia ponticola]THH37081.1 alpha/beta fold hydrolase [Aliishimia ponticola]
MLATQIYDSPNDTLPCLIVHGLFGSGRNWGAIAKRMSQARRVVTVDMRNHGESPHLPTHSYEDLAGDLAEVIENHGGPMDVIGHSMGGKAAMTLALMQPDLVHRLIVADIAPVAYTHSQSQFIEAMNAVDLSKVTRRSEAAEQLAAQGVEPALQSFFTQSLDLGAKRWRYNLGALEAEMPKILGFPDIDASFDGPTLFLTGSESDYVRPEHRPRIKALFPASRFAKLPGAGHWLHADKPKGFIAAAETFLSA